MDFDRRGVMFGAAASVLAASIARAAAIDADVRTGTLADVEHVVILMQENRSFDHYFGAMNGVRGFADRFPIPLADAPNAPQFPGPQVQPAEAQSVLRRVKPGQLPGVPGDRRVPVEPGLRRAAVLAESQREPRRCLPAQRVDALVQSPDVLLLTADFAHRRPLPFPGQSHRKIAG